MRPYHVAIVGAGPSGFFAAASLLKAADTSDEFDVAVDMLEMLPTPWGLVRSGVAPDHPKIKSISKQFEKTAEDARFRFFGNVVVGEHVMPAELAERYDAVIYAIGTWEYGVFHMADYPIFLGIAVYLALAGLQRDFFGVKAIDIVRWSAGITLMWASIEKWAYPEWTYPLLAQHPGMTLGFDSEFYMRAAGAVEFALAFSLVWTPLVRRVGAIMLTPMFLGAVFTFGKVDLIGHTLIVVVLFAIIGDDRGRRDLVRYPYLLPVGYAAALALFMACYYLSHTVLYGTPIT